MVEEITESIGELKTSLELIKKEMEESQTELAIESGLFSKLHDAYDLLLHEKPESLASKIDEIDKLSLKDAEILDESIDEFHQLFDDGRRNVTFLKEQLGMIKGEIVRLRKMQKDDFDRSKAFGRHIKRIDVLLSGLEKHL